MIPILERSIQHTYGLLGKTRRHNITNSHVHIIIYTYKHYGWTWNVEVLKRRTSERRPLRNVNTFRARYPRWRREAEQTQQTNGREGGRSGRVSFFLLFIPVTISVGTNRQTVHTDKREKTAQYCCRRSVLYTYETTPVPIAAPRSNTKTIIGQYQ